MVNSYAYDDYGQVATNATETISNAYKYVGKYGVQTDANDLLYMRARYYMPSVGRFINKDPIGFGGGLNQFVYVAGNPINGIDPSGLLYEWAIALLGNLSSYSNIAAVASAIAGQPHAALVFAGVSLTATAVNITFFMNADPCEAAKEGVKMFVGSKTGDVASLFTDQIIDWILH